jgi:hypothetical protein
MNINQKKLKLVVEGIRATTLDKMSDKQVDILFSKLQEQITTTTKQVKTVTVPPNIAKTTGADIGGVNVKTDTNGNVVATEMQENELGEKFESKKQQKYFFTKCGDGKTKEQKKWCKMADEFKKKTNFAKLPEKKETKEGYLDMVGKGFNNVMKNKVSKTTPSATFGESEIEKQIMRLVEKHITPKMRKEDLLSLIEGDTKTAPVKPKVTPGTKPDKDSPYKPKPGIKPAPKAKKEIGEDTKTAPVKPKVRPGTKPDKDSPYKPKPGIKPAPKAKKNLPSWLSFNSLGLKLKG